ncbi:MAG: hypothetical protein LH618_03590, partial [Saprospiraceae bacterium]|nr:hypothetical protein [Saprospiraceae bacterium]
MFSHLDPTCSGQNIDYVMQPSFGSNQARRIMTDPEQQIFCALGYQVSSSTVTCDGDYAIANYDNTIDLSASCCPKVYYSCAGQSIHIAQQDLLCNDISNGNLQVVRLRSSSFNTNIQITPNGDGWDINLLTPQFGSLFLSLLYTVRTNDGECRMHNQRADVLWHIDNCRPAISADPCTNLLSVHDFENFNPDQTPLNGYHVWFGHPFRMEGDDDIGTPDIINATNGNNYLHLYNALHDNNPNVTSTGREAVTLELQQCVEPGGDLHLAMDISRVVGTGPATLEIWGSSVAPCPVLANATAAINNHCGRQSACSTGEVFDPICITTIKTDHTGSFGLPNLYPAFPNGLLIWPNETNQNVCFLTLVPAGVPNIGIGIDNITASRVYTPTITCESNAPLEVCAGATVDIAFQVCASHLPGGDTTLISPTLTVPAAWTMVGGSLAAFPLSAGQCETLHLQFMVPADAPTGSIPQLILSGTATGVCTTVAWTYSAKMTLVNCIAPASFTCACGPGGLHIDAGEAPTDPKESIPGLSVTHTALHGGQNNQNWYTNSGKCIAIRGYLLIDSSFDLTIEGGEIKMQPGARIIVKAGGKLTLKNVNGGNPAEPTQMGMHGCEKMWRSIVVEPGGTLHLNGNIIQDAEYAVDVQGGSPTPCFDASDNDFDRNHVGIRITGAVIQSQPFQNNAFHASHALLAVYTSGMLNWHSLYPFAGLDLTVTMFTIGAARDSASENLFHGLRNGILASSTELNVYYAKFTDLVGSLNYNQSPDLQYPQGVGISAKNGGALQVNNSSFGGSAANIGWRAIHVVRGNLRARWNTMYDIASGIYVTPAGQSTNIAIEDNDFRVTLPNFPLGQAAFVINNINAGTDIALLHNFIQIKGNGPAILLSNGLQNNSAAIRMVSGNYIYHSHRFQEGIRVDHSNGWTLDDNHIFYSGFPEDDVFTQVTRGILLSNSDQCLLRENEIRATDGNGTGNSMHGIALLGSEHCTLCCNLTDKTAVGNYFMGNCDATSLRSGQFYDHHIGLQCDGIGTVIGDQNWLGNRWLGSYGLLGALHTGSPADASASEFRIELPQTSALWPLRYAQDSLGTWFIPQAGSSGNCAQCPALSPPNGLEHTRNLTDNEISIANDLYT